MQIQHVTTFYPSTEFSQETEYLLDQKVTGCVRTLFFEDPFLPQKSADLVLRLHKTVSSRLSLLPKDLIDFYLRPMLLAERLQTPSPFSTDLYRGSNTPSCIRRIAIDEPVYEVMQKCITVMENGNIVITQLSQDRYCPNKKRIYSAGGQFKEERRCVKSYELQVGLEESILIHNSADGIKTLKVPLYVKSVHIDNDGNIYFIGETRLYGVTKDFNPFLLKDLDCHTFLHHRGTTLSQTLCVDVVKKRIYTIRGAIGSCLWTCYDFNGRLLNNKVLELENHTPRFMKLDGNGNVLIDCGKSNILHNPVGIPMFTPQCWNPIIPRQHITPDTWHRISGNDSAFVLNNGQIYVYDRDQSQISIYSTQPEESLDD